jgi:hypothetical protein
MNKGKTSHHEGHEGITGGFPYLRSDCKVECCPMDVFRFFFVCFVTFVVQVGFVE